jgi:soluble lytic murein transglycosylase-like protein
VAPNPQLAAQIYQESLAQGVPPAIALAVAQQESGIQQTTASGNLVTGSAGEIGVFQLMPATAAGLGVDPTDVSQNVSGGVSLLAQLYQKYGDWAAALSAYNSGSPTGSPTYANSVLTLAGNFGATSPALPGLPDDGSDSSATSSISPTVVIFGGVGLLLAVAWWID